MNLKLRLSAIQIVRFECFQSNSRSIPLIRLHIWLITEKDDRITVHNESTY